MTPRTLSPRRMGGKARAKGMTSEKRGAIRKESSKN
jgi:hypothetical protein